MNFDNWTVDAWLDFAQDHWIVFAVAIVAIFIIMKLVQTVVKWAIAAAIIIGVVLYGGYNLDDLKAVGAELTTKVTEEAKDQVIKTMAGEAEQAAYTDNGDGTYSIKTPNLELTGELKSAEVTVKLRGVSMGTWKLEGAVQDFVDGARNSAK